MIEVINYQNELVERSFEKKISQYYDEARKLLPTIPETIKIYFSDYGILEDTGIGGYAYAHDIITVSINPDFEDKDKQEAAIRPTIFHESFHLCQNYTGEGPNYTALEGAVYEGMATVFEGMYADTFEPYGDYDQATTDKLKKWIEELQKFGPEYYDDEKIYSAWKFYHPELKEQWIAYKVGTWITDQVLKNNKLTILDLSTKTAEDILKLYYQKSSNTL